MRVSTQTFSSSSCFVVVFLFPSRPTLSFVILCIHIHCISHPINIGRIVFSAYPPHTAQSLEARCAGLTAALGASETTIARQHAAAAEAAGHHRLLEHRIAETADETAQLHASLDEAERELSEAKARVAQLESRLAEAATQLLSVHAAAQAEATELRRRADDAEKQRAAVDVELQARG
jgi:hypothetical protein